MKKKVSTEKSPASKIKWNQFWVFFSRVMMLEMIRKEKEYEWPNMTHSIANDRTPFKVFSLLSWYLKIFIEFWRENALKVLWFLKLLLIEAVTTKKIRLTNSMKVKKNTQSNGYEKSGILFLTSSTLKGNFSCCIMKLSKLVIAAGVHCSGKHTATGGKFAYGVGR